MGSELDHYCGVSEKTFGVAAEDTLPDSYSPIEVNKLVPDHPGQRQA